MGISGLLPLLKSIHRPTELKCFHGQTLGVDAYGWLHRGAIACAVDLAQGKPTRKYATFVMGRVQMLKHFGVQPYLVFDGDYLPSKGMTEEARAKRREDSRKAGLELLKAGKPSKAHSELQKSIDVTPEMARILIEELKKNGIPYVVAPYEADAQLVYLEREGIISGILSEDSDLLIFGAKRLLTKLDKSGRCVEINRRDFAACRGISLTGWTDTEFRQMAILSGCDYLDSINGMGLKTAYRLVRKHKKAEKVIQMLQFDGQYQVPPEYAARFRQAELTFLYQRVFCPRKQEQTFLNPLPPELIVEEIPYVGAHVEPVMARRIAVGDVNPMTKESIDFSPQGDSAKKRRASSTTSASIQPAAVKHPSGKPIESYFGGDRRIPLGEMDPNCFSVDPDRLGSITENGDRSVVFPLPRPYVEGSGQPSRARSYLLRAQASTSPRIMRRRTEPIAEILRNNDVLPTSSRRQSGGSASTESTVIEPPLARPAKKARLCDDPILDSIPAKQKSKFFSQGGKPPRGNKSADVYLMSDDSITEALQDLPDLDSWHRTKEHKNLIKVFDETSHTLDGSASGDLEPTNCDPPGLAASCDQPSSHSLVESTPITSKFAFQQSKSQKLIRRSPPSRPTPASSVQSSTSRSSEVSMHSSSTNSSTKSTPATPMMTPLQRMGVRALNRKAQATPSDRSSQPPQCRSPRKSDLDSFPINPSFVPLPRVTLEEVEALHLPVGSEDLILPESEGEEEVGDDGHEEDFAQGQDQTKRCKPLDLSRFLFA